MANYKIKQLHEGYDGRYEDHDRNESEYYTASVHTVLVAVTCTPEDEVLSIPSHDGDKPITHIGYREDYTPPREEWCDWHHCKGGMNYPAIYKLLEISLGVPASIKKITIPKTVRKISSSAFASAKNAIFEVHPDNPYLTVEDNKIVEKK